MKIHLICPEILTNKGGKIKSEMHIFMAASPPVHFPIVQCAMQHWYHVDSFTQETFFVTPLVKGGETSKGGN